MGLTKKILTTSAVAGGTLGALALFNKVTEAMAGEADTVLIGEERRYPWKYGDMFYAVTGSRDARPLVLFHSFGSGASSYEWRRNVETLAEQFCVYTPDLLGFGLSDRPAVAYDAELYADLVSDFVREVVGKPAFVVAHGLTCAYVIASAYRRPQLFERLVLVAPPQTILQEQYPTTLNSIGRGMLRTPIVGEFVYNLLTSRQAIRNYYDKQGYHNPGLITDELVEYIYTSAHQPNSRYATAAFRNGYLDLNVQEPFARLQMPVVAVWGRESIPSPTEVSAAFKRINPNLDARILDKCSFHLQDEQAAQFNNLLREIANVPVK